MAPVIALPTLRSHPRWYPRWGLRGACSLGARSCGPSRTLSLLPPHPAAMSPGGGGAALPPLPASPTLGGAEVCGGGGGPLSSSLHSTHVAGTMQAWRRHEARHLSLCRGGGLQCVTRRPPSYPACAPLGVVVPSLSLRRMYICIFVYPLIYTPLPYFTWLHSKVRVKGKTCCIHVAEGTRLD